MKKVVALVNIVLRTAESHDADELNSFLCFVDDIVGSVVNW